LLKISGTRSEIRGFDELAEIESSLNTKKGGIFSSGSEYPGRHSKWDIAFVNPALEFICSGESFSLKALSSQGEVILKYIAPELSKLDCLAKLDSAASEINGLIERGKGFFTEEERSRQPSVFTVLRSIREFFSHQEEALQHFGFYGAFGFDLVHQFEEIERKLDRPEGIKDCHLYLPLELILIERQREKAFKIRYDVEGSLGSTKGLESAGADFPLPPASGESEIQSDHKEGEFISGVQKVIDGTKQGDFFEVVLSQAFETRAEISPVDLFRALSSSNPSPYLFLRRAGRQV